jgi:hypothetical protein
MKIDKEYQIVQYIEAHNIIINGSHNIIENVMAHNIIDNGTHNTIANAVLSGKIVTGGPYIDNPYPFKVGDVVRMEQHFEYTWFDEVYELEYDNLYEIIDIDKYGDLALKKYKGEILADSEPIFDINVYRIAKAKPQDLFKYLKKNKINV